MNRANVVIDVEADGQCPGLYSMVSFGAVVFDYNLDKTFYAEIKPISERWCEKALSVSGFTREQTLEFEEPGTAFFRFNAWLQEVSPGGRPFFFSDNNGFDWQFINYYFFKYLGYNPFGHTSNNINNIWKGMEKNMFVNFKHMRKVKHTHNALDDAMGNATALLEMKKRGLKIRI